jgi:diketogulonate reductase-like aldo/keto reductase
MGVAAGDVDEMRERHSNSLQFIRARGEREILPLAAERRLGVIMMRPFAEGGLMRRKPSARELAPLRPFGVATWAQTLVKWILSDQRCHITILLTSRPGRMSENADAGRPPWFDAEACAYVSRLAGN